MRDCCHDNCFKGITQQPPPDQMDVLKDECTTGGERLHNTLFAGSAIGHANVHVLIRQCVISQRAVTARWIIKQFDCAPTTGQINTAVGDYNLYRV